jgi:hypothetical protein
LLVIARKVAGAYRQALSHVDPALCAQVDGQMQVMGQTWVAPRLQRFDPDDWLCVQDAADLAHVEPDTLGTWRRRGRITGREVVKGRWEYRARDVLAMSVQPRRRRKRNEEGNHDGGRVTDGRGWDGA